MSAKHRRIARTATAAIIALAMYAAPLAASPRATAQATCQEGEPLRPGLWSGGFASSIRREWSGSVPSLSRDPGNWAGSTTVTGRIEMAVPQPDAASGAVTGVARATWNSRVEAVETNRPADVAERGWLSGGVITLASAATVQPGSVLEWTGAWWTADTTGNVFSRQGRIQNGPFFDGPLTPRPAEPLIFRIESASCTSITGTLGTAQFWAPAAGREPDVVTVEESGRFRLDACGSGIACYTNSPR